jgi:hypothetical protein
MEQINEDFSCRIKLNPEDIKQVADNYRQVLPAITGNLSEVLLTAIKAFTPQIQAINTDLADLPEAFEVWKMSGEILHYTLSEKGLKQYHGLTVESLAADKKKFNEDNRPVLEASIKELQGIIDNAIEIQNKLKVLLGGNNG